MLDQGMAGVFSGAMATPIARLVKKIEIVENAVFTILEFRFDAGEAQQVNPNTFTYPAGNFIILKEIKRFQLASGKILVHFAYAK